MVVKQFEGYTILEAMIVITISAAMFVSVVIAFGGRQQEIQFTQAVRSFDARLNDIINDVSTGYFDNSGNLSCTLPSADPDQRPFVSGASASQDIQGSSDECVFLGKAIQFYPQTDPASKAASKIRVFNLLGRRTNGGSPANSIQTARPIAVAPATDGDPNLLEDEVSKINLDWGLKVTDIRFEAPPVNSWGVIGFFTSFSSTFSSGISEEKISNNQKVRYAYIPDTLLNQLDHEAVAIVNTITDKNPPDGADRYINLSGINNPVTICLQSADENRRAAIVIGADGTTSTLVQFDDYDRSLCVS